MSGPNDTYIRLRKLADIQAQLDNAKIRNILQLELDVGAPGLPQWRYEPRPAPTAENQSLPCFVKIQAE